MAKEIVLQIPLAEIEVNHAWNPRGNRWQNKATEEDKGFEGLVESIKNDGLQSAVLVRQHPDPKSKFKYTLVFGFRRFEAVRKIATENGDKAATIKAEFKELTEAQARAANTAENAARESLSVPDLAWAIAEMAKGSNIPDIGIAAQIGKSNGYVGELHRIVKQGAPKVIDLWRNSKEPLKVKLMTAIVKKTDHAEQLAKYMDLIAKTEENGKEKTDAEKKAAKLEAFKKKAKEIGHMLGRLDHESFLKSDKLDFGSALDAILPAVTDAGLTAAKRRAIAEAAEQAWHDAHSDEEEESEEEEDDEDAA